jgi:copper ion binding protein
MAAFAKVKYSVEGMTCQSCCKTIHAAVSDLAGVRMVEVSLETDSATVVYDVSAIEPITIKETILDCGFDVTTSSEVRVTFDVEGMTCQSCVKTTEGVLADLDGIIETKTSLERDQTWIRFDQNNVSQVQLKTAIEDYGFDAKVSGNTCSPKSPTLSSTFDAQGDDDHPFSNFSEEASAESPLLGQPCRQKRGFLFGRRSSPDQHGYSQDLIPISPLGDHLRCLSIKLCNVQRSSELETRLLSKEGVKAVRFDWSVKTAKVTYDPCLISSVQIQRDAEEMSPCMDQSGNVEMVQLMVCHCAEV